MSNEMTDLTLPAHDPTAPKPRGILPVPPEVEVAVADERARLQPYFTDDYAKRMRNDMTLRHWYEGTHVAYRYLPQGVQVLAVGWDEVGAVLETMSPEERQGVFTGQP